MSLKINFLLILFSFLLSNKLIKLFLLKLKGKFIDIPNIRSLHSTPKPSGAGIIFTSITIFSSILCLFVYGYSNIYLIPVLCIPLALIGIIDDLYQLSSFIRYVFHVLTSTAIVLTSNIFVKNWFGENYFNFLLFILIIFIFTAFINFINFMDGIDGLVGGALFISILSCCIFLKIGQPYIVLLSSLIAFIIWNWSPAKIFMGDVGSTFLGAINIGLISLSNNLSDAFGLVLILTPFIVDPLVCVLRRYFYNQNIFEAHCLHLYQRLLRSGMKESNISLIYILFTSILSINFLFFGLLPTFITSIFVIMLGFYLDQKVALSFELAMKRSSVMENEE